MLLYQGMESFNFADDAPRFDPWTEDDFGYRPFAKHLADVLVDLSAPNGYVVGVHGAWGAGKTTALNFVRHFVTAENAVTGRQPLEIILFQPWMFSGQQDLMSAFFRVLAEKLKGNAERIGQLKAKTGKAAKVVVDPLVNSAVTMAIAAHPSDTTALKASGELTKRALTQTIDAWLGEPTLQAAHDDLSARLKKSGRRFLVIVDDIDRLEPTEVRSIMQMVKSVGRLPNVIYVLAYDRRIVWRALAERETRRDGEPTFIEKIVQHEVELPHATRSALLTKLDRELAFILPQVRGGARWFDIVRHGVHWWVRSPRDILRYSNALRFAWPPLKDEVDAADVLAMEGLRLFDASVFDWVRNNRDFLIDGPNYQSEEDKSAYAAAFRRSLDPVRQESVIELLATLFASRSKYFRENDRFSSGEIWADVVNRRGIASAHGFEAYFALFPSPHTLPKSVIDAATAAPDDREVQDQTLKTAIEAKDEAGRSLIGQYLEGLSFRMVGRDKIKPGKAMILALLDHGAFIQHQPDGGSSFFSPHVHLQQLVRDILASWDVETASTTLVEFIERCQSASVAASLYVWRAREVGVLPAEGAKTGAVISDATLVLLGERALALILKEAADGTLINAPFYWDIVETWRHLAELSPAREWLMSAVEIDPHALAKVARGILATSVSDDRQTIFFFRGFSSDRPFYDVPRLLAACETFAGNADFDQEEQARVVALRDGLRRYVVKQTDDASIEPEA